MFKRAKILSLILVAIFVYYFAFDFSLINIEKTALVISIGVDKQDNEYEVTAQIALPEANNSKATNRESVISAKGSTLYQAISVLSEQTGWYPKLSFCNLIVLGNSLLEENVMDVLDFFLLPYKVEDTAILCATDGSAKELLLSSSPLDNVSGLSLSKIFVRDYKDASKVLTSSIKSFTTGYFSRSKLGYMPIVKTVKTDEKGEGGKTSSASSILGQDSSGNSSGGSSGGEQELVIYDASNCALFSDGKKVSTLNGDQVLCFSFIDKGVNEAFFTINSIDGDGKMGKMLIAVKRVKGNKKLVYENGEFKLKIDIALWLKIHDANFSQSIKELSNLGTLNDKNLYDSKVFVENRLQEVFDITKNSGCDLFEIKNLLYKFHFNKFKENEGGILNNVSLELNITTKNFI